MENMATKIKKRTQRRDTMIDLNARQKHIVELRNKLNKPDPHQVKAFTKYKTITYISNVLFPPYALYRIWCRKSEFNHVEKLTQSLVAILIFVIFLLLQLERYKNILF